MLQVDGDDRGGVFVRAPGKIPSSNTSSTFKLHVSNEWFSASMSNVMLRG